MPLSDSKSKRRFLSRNNPLPIVLRSKMSRAPRTGSPQTVGDSRCFPTSSEIAAWSFPYYYKFIRSEEKKKTIAENIHSELERSLYFLLSWPSFETQDQFEFGTTYLDDAVELGKTVGIIWVRAIHHHLMAPVTKTRSQWKLANRMRRRRRIMY